MNSKTWISRRNVLRGLGVGLALPWLESLSPPPARAQAATPLKRYFLMYMPCGVARAYWPPKGQGAGTAWSLSALMEPLAPLKQYVQVITNGGQEALYNAGVNPNPSHSLYCAPSFSCTVPDVKLPILGGPTVDQIIAQKIGVPPIKSLQVGCSTMNSSSDGRHPSMTRSISWGASDNPLYKVVNPQSIFDTLVAQLAPGGGSSPAVQAATQLRKDRDISVLDYVIDEANAISAKLSASDKHRLDQFLTSVQDIEGRVKLQGTATGGANRTYTRPTLVATYNEGRSGDAVNPANDPVGYNRNSHAEVMNDLVLMAFETNLTNVISYMLDDARSDYHYNFLTTRAFTLGSATSVPINTPLNAPTTGGFLGYHGLSHDGDNNNGYATVNRWFVEKFAGVLDRLSKSPEAGGKSVLDNSILMFMSGMQGSSHQLTNLPILLAGGGKVFKNDYHNNFAAQVPLANIHLTILQAGFGITMPKLGYSTGIVPELLV